MMKNNTFFVDAESDGLYGKFLSVAVLVTDENGQEIDRFYGAVKISIEDISTQWVKENVYPYLDNADVFFDSEEVLLENFWKFWIKHRETSDCVAYVEYPVEARLFSTCVMCNLEERQFLGPFPLYDLATLLESKSIDFNCNIQELSDLELVSHDAMNDVRMCANVWHKYIKQK